MDRERVGLCRSRGALLSAPLEGCGGIAQAGPTEPACLSDAHADAGRTVHDNRLDSDAVPFGRRRSDDIYDQLPDLVNLGPEYGQDTSTPSSHSPAPAAHPPSHTLSAGIPAPTAPTALTPMLPETPPSTTVPRPAPTHSDAARPADPPAFALAPGVVSSSPSASFSTAAAGTDPHSGCSYAVVAKQLPPDGSPAPEPTHLDSLFSGPFFAPAAPPLATPELTAPTPTVSAVADNQTPHYPNEPDATAEADAAEALQLEEFLRKLYADELASDAPAAIDPPDWIPLSDVEERWEKLFRPDTPTPDTSSGDMLGPPSPSSSLDPPNDGHMPSTQPDGAGTHAQTVTAAAFNSSIQTSYSPPAAAAYPQELQANLAPGAPPSAPLPWSFPPIDSPAAAAAAVIFVFFSIRGRIIALGYCLTAGLASGLQAVSPAAPQEGEERSQTRQQHAPTASHPGDGSKKRMATGPGPQQRKRQKKNCDGPVAARRQQRSQQQQQQPITVRPSARALAESVSQMNWEIVMGGSTAGQQQQVDVTGPQQ